jgi:predicted permease
MGSKWEDDLDRQLRDHLDLEAEEHQGRLSPEEARRAAALSLGNTAAIKEDVREAAGWMWFERLRQDLRFAARVLLRSPGFSIVAILTLAVGIGATTAMFSQMNAVFWKMLPIAHPETLRQIAWSSSKRAFAGSFFAVSDQDITSFSYPLYRNIRDNSTALSGLVCWHNPGENRPVVVNEWGRVATHFISGNYFDSVGVRMFIGRPIAAEDDRAGGPLVAVISYDFWQRAFGGATSILNRTVTINGKPVVVAGVMQKGFSGLDPRTVVDVMLPIATLSSMMPPPNNLETMTPWTMCQVAGRLRPGMSNDQARAEIEALLRSWILANPPKEAYDMPRVSFVDPGQGAGGLRQETMMPLVVVMVVVSLLLVVVCTNVGGLLLARGASRQREVATRLALGAARKRLVRQLLTESLLLSVAGGTMGIAVALALSRLTPVLLSRFRPGPLGRVLQFGVDPTPDLRVLGFCIALALIAGLVFGLAPALWASRVDLLSMIKQSAPGPGNRVRLAGSKALITVQVALSVLLVIGAGLFIRTVINLRSQNLGYELQGLLMFRVEPRLIGIDGARRVDFFETAVKRLESIPGVTVSGSAIPPLGVNGLAQICIPDVVTKDPKGDYVNFSSVSPRFFETWQLPILLGRDIQWSDREGSERVVLVNQAFATKYFDGKDPLGRAVGGCVAPASKIIGVVADSKPNPRLAPAPTVYLPFRQGPTSLMIFNVRTAADPLALIPTIRRIIGEIDPSEPILDIITPLEIRDRLVDRERMLATLLAVFGSMALLLSCLGIYGMLAFFVNRRTAEIGVRMALGAHSQDIIRMVVRESLTAVVIGIALGITAAFILTHWVETMLFGISKNDPATLIAAGVLLFLTAVVAALIPARRASRLDPLRALRYD